MTARMLCEKLGAWSLPGWVVASRETTLVEVPAPLLDRTVVVIPRHGQSEGNVVLDDLAACCSGLVVCTDGPGEKLPIDRFWPHAVEVSLPAGPYGAAHARNVAMGVAALRRAEWAWLIDFDCAPASFTKAGATPCLQELLDAWEPGCAAVQGGVVVNGSCEAGERGQVADLVNTIRLFSPPQDEKGPQAIVTANALVHVPTAVRIGGFDSHFPDAGGEDIDFGVRIRQAGYPIAWAPKAVVYHDAMSYEDILSRMVRYGRGMARFAHKHHATEALTRMLGSNPWHPYGDLGELMFSSYLAGWQAPPD
jgi:Glycosyl transferase family group 2